MSKEMIKICESVLQIAKEAGANDCRVDYNKSRLVDVVYREHKPELVNEASTQNINIHVFADGCYSNRRTSDLRKDALKAFVIDTVESARLLEKDPFRSLPDPKYYLGRTEIDLAIYDQDYKNVTPDQRHTMAKELEAHCLKAGGNRVISVSTSVYDIFEEEAVLTSNGFSGEKQSTRYYAFGEMTVSDKGDRKPNGYDQAVARSFKKLPPVSELGKNTASRTMDLMGAIKIPTETMPVIIENRNVSTVLNYLTSAMSGNALQQKQSFLLNKKGEKIGSDIFTLVDDPHIIEGMGSRIYDNDGFATKKRSMVEKGVLNEYYIDWYRSRKMGIEPTTGSPTNLVLPPGKRSLAEIMKELGRGILINGFIGGNSNPNTGDFSIGISGKLFDKGEFSQNVAEMNIADNHLKFWNKLVEAANDPWIYSNIRMPSLVFKDIVVSGI
ncbi:MAG: TldD/PmbA family protein [Deltaproteobacteria bacterium]|nr:TldD/PmbA family protein [Deltaproteobacteria bacterium]